MGKKAIVKPTKSTAPAKKKIQRQNTMEQTASEGESFLRSLDVIKKRKERETKELKEKQAALEKTKKVKKTSLKDAPIKKSPSPKKKAATSKKPVAAAKKVAPSPIKKAASAPKKAEKTKKAKAGSALFGSSTTATTATTATAPSLFGSGLFGGSLFGSSTFETKSCADIASTEVIEDTKLGKQIIKKSLKGQPTSDEVKVEKKKGKPMRTKTGDRLAAGMIDIVFCCDTTGSMGSYLVQCKETINEIIKKIVEKTAGEGISVKFGFVAYRDHPPQDSTYLTCSYDLTNEEEIKTFIGTLSAGGGGDTPEAVMDGLYVSAKHMSWRDSTHIPSLRYIFHITDAPPHGKEYNGSGYDCPCKLDINKVSHIMNMKQIHYRLISAEQNSLKKMADIFKEKIVDYEECNISNAKEMDIKISDMIIRELLPDMVEEEDI